MGKALLGHKVNDRVYVPVNERMGYYIIVKAIENTTDDSQDEIRSY